MFILITLNMIFWLGVDLASIWKKTNLIELKATESIP